MGKTRVGFNNTDTYNDAGELIEVQQPQVANADAGGAMATPTTYYTYDVYGDELSEKDADGNITTYTYDALGRELTRTLPSPNAVTEYFTYDPMGREQTHTDFDGNVATYNYNTLGQIQQIIYTGTGKTPQTVNYTYTPLGQQYTVEDASGTTTYSYDANGDITQEVTPEGTINYIYNNLDQQIETWTALTATTPQSSATTDTKHSYNNLGQLAQAQVVKLNGSAESLTTNYAYNGDGDKAYEADPNGDVTTYGYDTLDRLLSELVVNGGTTLYQVTYTLYADGTRHTASETEYQSSGGDTVIDTAWTYDNLDRLLTQTITSGGTTEDAYTYDLDGNLIADQYTLDSLSPVTTTYSYNGDNELTGQTGPSGSTTYLYDNNGSETSAATGSTTTTFTYDVRNRLIKVSQGSSVLATYLYDDAGNRVKETTGGVTTFYLIDSNNPSGYPKPIEQRTSTTGSFAGSTLSMSYIIGDRVLAQATGSGVVSCLLVDGQDNTRLLVNSSGAVTATFNYDAFGNPIGFSAATAPTSILFQQTMFDAPSGLNFFDNGQREEKLGAPNFIESDPPIYGHIQNPVTLNSYLLDGANPISNIDPNGHDFTIAELGVASLISAIAWSLILPNTANAPEIGGATYADTSGQLIWAIPADMGGVLIGKYIISPAAQFLVGKLKGAFTSAARALIGSAGGEASVNIAARTSDLIASGTGVNITPMSVINNSAYATIGKGGRTWITDLKAVTDIIGPLDGDTVTITTAQAQRLQQAIGLRTPLQSENVITLVNDVASRGPASPIDPSLGNDLFQGPGQGLPGGGPELTINGIPTRDAGAGLTRITLKVAN